MEKMETKPKILVVDSERGFVETVRKVLESTFEVVVASSIKEGLDKAKRQSPDLIIVGYLEPRGTSFELHNKLREGRTTRDIPLLVVDVRPEEHLRKGWRRDEGMKMNAEEYMSRPFEPAELKETVNRILHRVGVTTMELAEVLEQMEMTLARIDQIEKQLVK